MSLQIIASAVLFAGLGAILAWWIRDIGWSPDDRVSHSEWQALEQQVAVLTEERDSLRAIANAAESQINIEKATQKQLADQTRRLIEENNRLKDDLAFFEKLLPAKSGRGVSIRSLSAELIAPNQIRYRVLIMQGGKSPPSFVGELQLAVMLVAEVEGANAMMVFPQESQAESSHFALNFRQYQRLEGILILPEGVGVTAVQARVLEKGKIRAQELVNL